MNLIFSEKNVIQWSTTTAKEFLLNNSHGQQIFLFTGVYTTCRTVQLNKIFDLKGHLERLESGYKSLNGNDLNTNSVLQLLKSALLEFQSKTLQEGKATILCLKEGHAIHVSPLLPPPKKAQCIMAGKPRHNATVKDSLWVADRQPLENPKFNEVLLSENGEIYEGLTSNFACILNGKLLTSPLNNVLPGTVLKLALEICKKLEIPVEFRNPKISEIHEWEGAFITSTSRLILPIDEITISEK